MDDSTIKNNIFRKRTQLGYSQSEMADRLSISLSAYRKIENGPTRIINEHVGKFAEEVGISMSELVNGFEPLNPAEASIKAIEERHERRIRVMETGYLKEIESLKARIETLEERLKDKDDTILSDKKLIRRYEKELNIKND